MALVICFQIQGSLTNPQLSCQGNPWFFQKRSDLSGASLYLQEQRAEGTQGESISHRGGKGSMGMKRGDGVGGGCSLKVKRLPIQLLVNSVHVPPSVMG